MDRPEGKQGLDRVPVDDLRGDRRIAESGGGARGRHQSKTFPFGVGQCGIYGVYPVKPETVLLFRAFVGPPRISRRTVFGGGWRF